MSHVKSQSIASSESAGTVEREEDRQANPHLFAEFRTSDANGSTRTTQALRGALMAPAIPCRTSRSRA